MQKRIVVSFTVFLLSLSIAAALTMIYIHPTRKADIAIYAGRGTWEDSIRASQEMFGWMNYTVELVSAESINDNGLEGFRILCVPGGNMLEYSEDISTKGKENIRSFISEGGGYIGICGGAYFASERVFWRGSQLSMAPLDLFAGIAAGPIDEIMPYPNYAMCNVSIINHSHPITQFEPDSETMLYYGGPALIPNEDADVTVLGIYDVGNQAAIVAFHYGPGNVFLIGTHPEIEENNSRDEVTFADEFDDAGSDWVLMHNAVSWCVMKQT